MIKHGIYNNDIAQQFEAWRDDRIIGICPYGCKESTKIMWKERYGNNIGIKKKGVK